jgi:erythromycin esterase
MFGAHYAMIGSAVGVSDANGAGRPEAGSLEVQLAASAQPALFIPTYKVEGFGQKKSQAL